MTHDIPARKPRVRAAIYVPLLLLALTSCRNIPNPDYTFMGRFAHGTERSVIDSVKNADPTYTFTYAAENSNATTRIDLYEMIISNVPKRVFGFLALGPAKTKYDFIAFAYQNDKLIYAGTPDDFKKSMNLEVAKLGEKLSQSLLQEF